jgi:tetratricopeptide (TPR) repeat protein
MQVRYMRARAQITTDPKRYFIDTIGSLRRLGQTDPTTIDQACGMYAGGAALFAYSGISFAIGRRFLDIARGLVREGNVSDLFFYRAMQSVCDYLEGNWGGDRAIDEALVTEALRLGQVWDIFVYRGLEAERRAHRGDFAGAREQIARLKELSDVYGFVTARSNEYAMTAVLLIEEGRFEPALEMLDLYYTSQHEDVFHTFALASRAKVETLRGDHAAASATMAAADTLVRRIGLLNAYNMGVYLGSRLLYDVTALERAGNGPGRRALARQARRSMRRAVRIAAKVARERPEVYRLAGRLAWLLGNEERATAWWARSIDAAKALGARPELGRTYREVGVSLAGSSRVRELRGMDAGGYLDAAQRVFAELGLDRDAGELGARVGVNVARMPAAG